MTRNHLIGGTDAASLLGLGRMSPVALYLRLTGEVPDDFEGNEATDAGRLFEDRVAVDMIDKHLGMRLVRPDAMTLALPDEPRIGASFDFEVAGKQELAEIKLTGSRAMWGEPGEKVPLHVAAQAQFQMAVARAAGRAVPCVHVIAMFVPGFTLEPFDVPEDRDLGNALLGRARSLLRQVDTKTPPKAGDEADARALFLGKRGEALVLTPEQIALIDQLRTLKGVEAECEKQIKTLRDALLPTLGTATELLAPSGEVIATWRPNKQFDATAFIADHADLANSYMRTSLDASALKNNHKKLCETYMREPVAPADQVRPFKLKGQ